jgi:hypothetical protein
MNKQLTKKTIGIAASAALMTAISFSAPALADDCGSDPDPADILAMDVETLQLHVACGSYPEGIDTEFTGEWPRANPVWQYQAGNKRKNEEPLEGCEVHYKLSKKLKDEAVTNENKKGGNKLGLRGAYASLLDGKLQSAWDALESFKTMANDATLNPNFVDSDGYVNVYAAADQRDDWIDDAESIQHDIMCLMP